MHQLRRKTEESATCLVTQHGVTSGAAGGARTRDDPMRSNYAHPGQTAGIAAHTRSSYLRRSSRRDRGRVSPAFSHLARHERRAGSCMCPGAARAQSQESCRRAQRGHRHNAWIPRRDWSRRRRTPPPPCAANRRSTSGNASSRSCQMTDSPANQSRPFTPITQTFRFLARFEVKAILLPSGDHVGHELSALCVN